MKIRKNYFLLFFIFFISGCSVDYHITISDNTIDEFIQIDENINNIENNTLFVGNLSYKNSIDNLYTIPQPVYNDSDSNLYNETETIDGVQYYDKEMIFSENIYGININYNHEISNYVKANTINTCYNNVSVLQNGSNLILSTNRENICFERYSILDNINIYIKFDDEKYKVVDHNADSVNQNEYYWNINRNNYNNKSIVIELEELDNEREHQNAMLVLVGIIAIICVSAIIIFIVAKNQRASKNKI